MKRTGSTGKEEMLAEYDFRRGERGKYAKRHGAGTNVVVLDPDVAVAFPDASSVNEALRALVEIARRNVRPKRRPAANRRAPGKK